MSTSQLAEQEALNGPSLEKAYEGYSATLRSSTRSRLDFEVLGARRNKPNA
jgi:hypothetical protein